MADSTPIEQKPIHSLIIDTGPLIKNTISLSTIVNSADNLCTTSAILSEIRDEATRSRVQTTLMPFLNIRNPSSASYDAVIAFSKKTGDYSVLSRQDLGILALAYEVHCERNGGNWGLREVPKGPLKEKPGEGKEKIEKVKEQITSEPQAFTQPSASEDGWPQQTRRSKKGRNAKSLRDSENTKQLPIDAEELQQHNAQTRTDPAPKDDELAKPDAIEEGWTEQRSKRNDRRKITKSVQSSARKSQATLVKSQDTAVLSIEPTQVQHPSEDIDITYATEEQGSIATSTNQIVEQDMLQQPRTSEDVSTGPGMEQREKPNSQGSTHDEQHSTSSQELPKEAKLSLYAPQEAFGPQLTSENIEQDMSNLAISAQPQGIEQLTPPQTDSDDSDGDWITPSNLDAHQAKDTGLRPHIRTAADKQMDVATMTTDFAMQNVLLQMNLHLLSTNMQRIKHLSTKVLRCHACFNIVKQMDKQFCPRCGQATLQRVSCSTNAKGEFRIHLAKNYQHNKRGDKYSVPKPIAGTANTRWNGQGGGQGGWGRDLILSEDQKEYTNQVTQDKKDKAKDLMDQDYLPGILTGDRGKAGGKLRVGAGKNVNAKKRA